MAGIALTGSASGIGAATRRRLETEARCVIGVDLRDAEVIADLGTPTGGRPRSRRSSSGATVGSVLFVDGGTDALVRPDTF